MGKSTRGVQRMPMTKEHLDYMVKVRESQNWSPSKMAEFCGCEPRTIYYFEAGVHQSPRILCYYLHLMTKEEVKAFLTSLIMHDRGVPLIG